MAFEKFIHTGSGGSDSRVQGFRVYFDVLPDKSTRGQLVFSIGMFRKLDFKKYECVEVLHDKEKKIVALRLNNEQPDLDNRRFVKLKDGNKAALFSTSLARTMVNQYGYPARKSLAYELKDDLVVLTKDEAKDEEQ